MKQKEAKSKMASLKYSMLEMEPYLQSPIFKPAQAAMLMALRTRTVRAIETDFVRGQVVPSGLWKPRYIGKSSELYSTQRNHQRRPETHRVPACLRQ